MQRHQIGGALLSLTSTVLLYVLPLLNVSSLTPNFADPSRRSPPPFHNTSTLSAPPNRTAKSASVDSDGVTLTRGNAGVQSWGIIMIRR